MIAVKYPDKKPSIAVKDGTEKIFCLSRKKWLVLTPEEWVRQNFLLYLIEVLKYPISLIAVEKQIYVGEVKKRFDIVVFDNCALPIILIECKEMEIALNASVLQQALNYHSSFQSQFIVITNGIHTVGFENKGSHIEEIHELMPFQQ